VGRCGWHVVALSAHGDLRDVGVHDEAFKFGDARLWLRRDRADDDWHSGIHDDGSYDGNRALCAG